MTRHIALQPRITWTIDGYRPWIECREVPIERCECPQAHADNYEASLCATALLHETQRSFGPDAYTMPEQDFDELLEMLRLVPPTPHLFIAGMARELVRYPQGSPALN